MENLLVCAIVIAASFFCWRRARRIWKAPEKGCGCESGCGGCGSGRAPEEHS